MGKRLESVERTIRRIVEAAIAEYAENGIENTSMQAVARRADVAPGTVLYHYESPNDLVEAVIEKWLAEMDVPSADSIDPNRPLDERVASLVNELHRLFERSEDAFRVWSMSPHHPVLQRSSAEWDVNVSEMLARTLGERAGEPETQAMVSVLVDPMLRGIMLARGIEPDRASEIVIEQILSFLES